MIQCTNWRIVSLGNFKLRKYKGAIGKYPVIYPRSSCNIRSLCWGRRKTITRTGRHEASAECRVTLKEYNGGALSAPVFKIKHCTAVFFLPKGVLNWSVFFRDNLGHSPAIRPDGGRPEAHDCCADLEEGMAILLADANNRSCSIVTNLVFKLIGNLGVKFLLSLLVRFSNQLFCLSGSLNVIRWWGKSRNALRWGSKKLVPNLSLTL